MREGGISPDVLLDVPVSRFDTLIEALLISLLAFTPLAFGAVQAWSEEVVVALAAAISITFLLKLVFQRDARLLWSWSYVPVALFILVAAFQLIPLRTALVGVISPGTAAVKKELLGDLHNPDSFVGSMTLSFYPNATKHDVRLVLAIAAVFTVTLNVFRRPNSIKRLLAAISIIGAGIAVLALAQDLFGNGKIYWLVPTGRGEAYSGTFINRSHYGQFINLSIGAALGLVMVELHEALQGKRITPPLVLEYLSSPAARVVWFLVAMVVIGAATVFVSLTRGGMTSMLIAAGFTTLVLTSRKSLKGRGWIMVFMALGAFICVVYTGFDAVCDRLASLRELHQYEDRWQILKDLSVSFRRFPVFGTGLGNHEVVYPMFDRSTIPALAAHAENEYAQAAEETGLVGLGALVGFAVIVWLSYIRNVRNASVPIRSAAYGLGFGLLAIMLHSLSDFGQHLPANATLSAVFCALLLALARMERNNRPATRTVTMSWSLRGLSITALLGICGIWAWALLGANSARIAEAHWKKALTAERNLMEKSWQGTNVEFADLISHAAAAAEYEPENVKYRHWLNVYRWRSISRVGNRETGETIIPAQAAQFVPRIIDELHRARALCPTFGATYCVVGQLEKFILDDPVGAEHIQTGYRLAPCDPTACFVAGFLDAMEGRIEKSFEKLKRAVQLDGRLFADVADVYVNHVSRPDLAVAIAGENTSRLSYVASALVGIQEHQEFVDEAQAKVLELLKRKCSEPDAPAGAFASLASICGKENDTKAAIEYYYRALALDYSQVHWHFNLARLLAENDRIPEAVHEARICLRLRPQFRAAEELIADLSVHPVVPKKPEESR